MFNVSIVDPDQTLRSPESDPGLDCCQCPVYGDCLSFHFYGTTDKNMLRVVCFGL